MSLPNSPTSEFGLLCKALMVGAGQVGAAEQWAEATVLPTRVRSLLVNRSVAGASTIDGDWAGNMSGFGALAGPFSDSVRTESAFLRLNDSAFVPAPFLTPLNVAIAGASATLVDQAAAKPLTRMTIGGVTLDPMKTAALLVMSRRLAADISSEGQKFFIRELRGAVASAVDAAFFEQLAAETDATAIPSSGVDPEDVALDLRNALSTIEYAGVGRASLNWVLAADVAKKAASMWSGTSWMFPSFSPTGGEILNLPALVSRDIPAGQVWLIDGSGIAAKALPVSIRTSTVGDVEMTATPTGDSSAPTPAQLTSLFQTDSVAIRAELVFSWAPLRENVCAVLEGCSWGGESSI